MNGIKGFWKIGEWTSYQIIISRIFDILFNVKLMPDQHIDSFQIQIEMSPICWVETSNMIFKQFEKYW